MGRHPQQLYDQGHLVLLVLARQEGIAERQLRQEAAEAPDIHGRVVVEAQDDLGRPVEPRLNVCVDSLIKEGRAAKVDDLDP